MLLISLIGEQPTPNLLPIYHLKPDEVLLVYTVRTMQLANRLKQLLLSEKNAPEVEILEVHAYDLPAILEKMEQRIGKREGVIFNITGGTKIMSLAAAQLAERMEKPFIYYQSEGNTSHIFQYIFQDGQLQKQAEEVIQENFTLKEYLALHLKDYKEEGYHKNEQGKLDDGGRFEQAVGETLKREGFEVLAGIRPAGEGDQLEIDLAFRLQNQVGIAEIKLGDKKEEGPKKGIDQLALATQREYIGTYAHRFLITARSISSELKKLAYAHGIVIISLDDYPDGRKWKTQLAQAVRNKMTPDPHQRI